MENGSTADHNSPDHRVVAVVQQLIAERRIADGRPIRSDHKLVEIGLTSMDLARLVLLIEDEFEMRIPVRDLIPTNFRSISSIIQLVSKLTVD
ncbi:MAG: acyl carrier protein [Deltaproteobacteria bacterium]|nr:acyl carrier protein [Deltaproteobacteria bacterium]